MASLDSLPADQRAVLQLVLQRDRSYDDIARMLSIDRAAVRERALAALDALGPQTRVAREERALITDYLLGQLPGRAGEEVRDRLGRSASERAWARVVASELAPTASRPLPEIPVEAAPPEPEPAAAAAARTPTEPRSAPTAPAAPPPARPPSDEPAPAMPPDGGPSEPHPAQARPSSRRGGALLLAAGALIAVIVVVVVIATGGSSRKHPSAARTAATTGRSAATSSGSTATPVAQINLTSPNAGSKAAGIAEVLRRGNTTGIAIVAQGLPANSKHDAYAVWLYNSPTDSHILGFVNPGVGANGRLQTVGGLPSNASRYKQLIITLETQANPHAPGKVMLQGALTGLS